VTVINQSNDLNVMRYYIKIDESAQSISQLYIISGLLGDLSANVS
jgi:hypothetical protein